MAKVLVILVSLSLAAVAEPPVGGRYLPPQQNSVGFPSSSYGAPSSSYGAPSSSYGAPSSSYGAPSSQYGAPGGGTRNTYAPPAAKVSFNSNYGGGSRGGISSKYGAPGGGRSSYRAPSSTYGTPSSSYGAPSTSYAAPSSSYGAPSGSYGAPSSTYGAPGGGYQKDDQSEPANYSFQYDVLAPEYNVEFGHQESRQYESARGSYYVLLPDGRKQKVEYVADEGGYKPIVTYTESAGGYAASRRPSSSYGVPSHSGGGGYQY